MSGVADAGYSLSFLARILDGVSWHRDTRREGRASLQSTIRGVIVWRVLFPKVCCVGAEESRESGDLRPGWVGGDDMSYLYIFFSVLGFF